LGSTQEASGEASRLLIAPLVLFLMIIRRWRQRLGIYTRQTIAAATLVPVVVMVIAPGSTLVVATATLTVLGDTIFFMKLSDNPTIVGIVGVLFVEDAVATTLTFIAFGMVPAALLMIRLHREDSSLLALGIFGLRLWGKRLWQVVHEEPPLLGLGASVGNLEEPDNEIQLIIHGQLLPHLDVGDARGEHGDDLLIGDQGNLVPHLAEVLDVLTKRLALVLTHRLKIILGGGVLIRGHEVGDELAAQVLP
jgi:fumarate reductase subunit C